jgi:hypothetical protein
MHQHFLLRLPEAPASFPHTTPPFRLERLRLHTRHSSLQAAFTSAAGPYIVPPPSIDHVVRLVMILLYYPTCHEPSRTNLDRGHQPEATCRAVSRAHALHGPERLPQPAKLLALTRKPAVVEERAG